MATKLRMRSNLSDFDPEVPWPARPVRVALAAPGAARSFRGPDSYVYEPVPGFKAPAETVRPQAVETVDTSDIPSINELTARYLGVEAVCGADDRVRQKDTTAWPFRTICSLLLTFKDGSQYKGTGWLIGPSAVLTAGHNLYDEALGWAASVKVMPGRNGTTLPYGSSVSARFYCDDRWVDAQDAAFDYGCAVTPDPIGDKTGWMTYGVLGTDVLSAAKVNVGGYPGDKPDGTLWYAGGPLASAGADTLSYLIDTNAGESGSPVWLVDEFMGVRWGVGIHNYGGCPNKATRITDRVFENIHAWANASAE